MFRAPFKLRDKKTLMKMLKRKDLNGEGGVYYDDVNESLAKCEKIVQTLTTDGKIIQIPRPCDKKKVLFYYDHSTDFDIGNTCVLAARLLLPSILLQMTSLSSSGAVCLWTGWTMQRLRNIWTSRGSGACRTRG